MMLVSVCYKAGYCDEAFADEVGLGLVQIYPVWDEDNSDERVALGASLADPYLAIIRDDSSLLLLQADDSGDLDEMTVAEDAASQRWLSACLYADKTGFFSNSKSHRGNLDPQNIFLFLLNQDHQLYVSAFKLYLVVVSRLMNTIRYTGFLT